VARAASFVGALVALNAAVLVLVVALTSGWAFTFIVEIPARETREQGIVPSTRDLLTSTAGAALFAATVCAAYALSWRRLPTGRYARIAGVLAVFVVVGSLTAVVANTKQGSFSNQFIGVTWALALIGAIAWGHGVTRRGPAVAGAVAILALLARGHIGGVRAWLAETPEIELPPVRSVTDWDPVAPDLRELAVRRSVYHPVYSDLNVGPRREVFPSPSTSRTCWRAASAPASSSARCSTVASTSSSSSTRPSASSCTRPPTAGSRRTTSGSSTA